MQAILAQMFKALALWALPGLGLGIIAVAFFAPTTPGGTFLAILIGILVWGGLYFLFMMFRRLRQGAAKPDPKPEREDWQRPL